MTIIKDFHDFNKINEDENEALPLNFWDTEQMCFVFTLEIDMFTKFEMKAYPLLEVFFLTMSNSEAFLENLCSFLGFEKHPDYFLDLFKNDFIIKERNELFKWILDNIQYVEDKAESTNFTDGETDG